jgi:hypothetical protein
MIFGVSPTKDAVVIAHTTGRRATFAIKSITSIPFKAQSGDDLIALLQRLVEMFDRGGKRTLSVIALLGSSSGRFKASVEAIKAQAIIELASAQTSVPVVKVTAASLAQALACTAGEKWHLRAGELLNPKGRQRNWSRGAAGAAAAAFKVAGDNNHRRALSPKRPQQRSKPRVAGSNPAGRANSDAS